MYYFIINPVAGNGVGKQNWNNIKGYLDQHKISYQKSFTRFPGDATEIVQRTIQQHSDHQLVFVTIGGDGTIDEVVSGILSENDHSQKSSIYPALIPSGFNNQFAKAYGISTNPVKAFQQIEDAQHPTSINVGHYTESIKNEEGYFLISLGVGFEGAMLNRENSKKHRWRRRGLFSFLIRSAAILYNQAPFSLMVERKRQRLLFNSTFLATCANINYYQSLQNQHHQLMDTKLNLMVAEQHNWLVNFWLLFRFRRAHLGRSRWGHEFLDQRFHFTTTSLEFVQKDGIEIGNRFVDITVNNVQCPFWQTSSLEQ